MRALDAYFKGLADMNRLRIINLLRVGELCGCDIQYVLNSSQSNVSRHLTYLKNSGLVQDRRSGYRVYYRLISTKANSGLFEFLKSAFRNDEMFSTDLKSLKEAIKDGACHISEASQQQEKRKRPKRRPAISRTLTPS
jgi:ArsR family transcriptional regulator